MATSTVISPPTISAFDRQRYFSLSELMERGWSRTAMRVFLREPDYTAMRSFYLRSRVIQAEASPLWQRWLSSGPKGRLAIECECG